MHKQPIKEVKARKWCFKMLHLLLVCKTLFPHMLIHMTVFLTNMMGFMMMFLMH